ncbi:MAG: type II secretion system protein GspM [Rhodothalassiaceae bacterium]
MTGRLPPWLSRGLALALLAVFLGGAATAVYVPLFGAYDAAAERLQEARDRLARYRRIAASAERIEQQAAAARAARAQSGIFLVGDTDALAAAALQNTIGALAREAGAELRSVQSLPAEERDGLVRIRLKSQLIMTTRSLERLLYALETGRPLLFVDDIRIRARLGRLAPRTDKLEIDSNFMVDLTVSGYRLGEVA